MTRWKETAAASICCAKGKSKSSSAASVRCSMPPRIGCGTWTRTEAGWTAPRRQAPGRRPRPGFRCWKNSSVCKGAQVCASECGPLTIWWPRVWESTQALAKEKTASWTTTAGCGRKPPTRCTPPTGARDTLKTPLSSGCTRSARECLKRCWWSWTGPNPPCSQWTTAKPKPDC